MCPSFSRQSDLRRIGFGAPRAVPKRTSNAQEASRGRLIVGNSQEGGNDDVQRNAHSAVSKNEKASTHELGRGH
jgi:hypothetical protein